MSENQHEPCFVNSLHENENENQSIRTIHHNLRNADAREDMKSEFEVEYLHGHRIQLNDFYEIKIDDFGVTNRNSANGKIFAVGFGGDRNHFLRGIYIDSNRHIYKRDPDRDGTSVGYALDDGDIIRVDASDDNKIEIKVGDVVLSSAQVKPSDGIYTLYIGFNQQFQRVTLLCNKAFKDVFKASEDRLALDKMRIMVASMNEGSPVYGEGVSKGGQYLLMDGMLVRRLAEKDISIINYSPGASSFVYDAKAGAGFSTSDMLPNGLHRIRVYLGGNELTIRRMHHRENDAEEYNVHIRSTLTGFQQVFHGTEHEWEEQRNDLLSYGGKYLINLSSQSGSIRSNDLKIAGTKCKTIYQTVAPALGWRVDPTDKGDKKNVLKSVMEQGNVLESTGGDQMQVPRLLLLGGDRSQSIGSITGAVSAYDDLCLLFFDAHFDMRDPNASDYPMVHGSPLFFLLQEQVKDALADFRKDPADPRFQNNQDQIKYAISFLESTPEGARYLEELEHGEPSYRGFEWLQDRSTKKIDPKRIAFVGMRSLNWEAGSTLGGPLPMFFKNLLQLDDQMHTCKDIRSKGVGAIFKKIIQQFRGAFDQGHLDKKDEEAGGPGRWIPPFMVSWDADSIDPNALPCTIAQEADGLSSEECLAFSDEIGYTKKMVMMEIIEFNPDLWKGYQDEPIEITLADFLAGAYSNRLRKPQSESGQRLDLQTSLKLLQDMIVRAYQTKDNCPES